jgi:hypothetical protein
MDDSFVQRLTKYCTAKGISQWMVTQDGYIFLSSDKGVRLRIQMLMKELRVMDLQRVPMDRPAPDSLVKKLFPMGVDEASILARMGQKYTNMAINAMCKIHVTKAKNAKIDACKDAKQAVYEGIIEYSQYNVIQNAKEAIADAQLNKEVGSRPKLDGELKLTFAKWTDNQKVAGTEKELVIKGLPGDEFVKRKHYFIYSKKAGYGKTTTVRRELVKKYSAHIINDINKAVGVPKTLQWLVFDEYSRTKKLDLEMLKILANGDASGAYLNRKSHGGSYIPPSDVQVIILSNYSG